MAWENGMHSRYFDLGMTDKRYSPCGTRARIKVDARFEVRNGCLVNVGYVYLKLGRGYGHTTSIEEVDALMDDLNAKRNAKWKMAREALAPYLRGSMCPHQLLGGLSAEQREKMNRPHKVRYCALDRELQYKRSDLGNVLLKRLLADGEAWVTDDEKKLAQLPSDFYLIDDKYPTAKVPDDMDVINDRAYIKYGFNMVPYYQLCASQQDALPEEEKADLECPICGHKAGSRYNPITKVTDFNAGQKFLDFCEHGSTSWRGYGWND